MQVGGVTNFMERNKNGLHSHILLYLTYENIYLKEIIVIYYHKANKIVNVLKYCIAILVY